jgi:uncharacterized protein YoxC
MADIMVEVISLLGFATKEIKQRRIKTYLKVLIGNTDVEDALQRLNNLTEEEARIASAELWRTTHSLGEGLQDVARDVEDIVDEVQYFHDRVESIDEGVQDVFDTVQYVNVRLQGVGHGVQDIGHNVQSVRDSVDSANRNLLRDSLRGLLSPPNPSTNHNILCKAHLKGTTDWFTRDSIFNDWKSAGSLLWIHGNPGSGKSVLCSAIIQDLESLRESGTASVAYFYCDFRDDNKQSCRNLLSSLLVQLSARSGSRCDTLTYLYNTLDRGLQEPSDCAMTECLKQMLTAPSQGPTYIILDALDECPNTSGIPSPRKQVLDLVKELVDLGLPNLHICVTSRPEVDIRDVLQPLALHQVSLHNEDGQKQAIVDYITYVVDSDENMQRWRKEDRDLVIKTLSEKADGMFQWVFCHLETLRQALPPSVRSILEGLPECLDKTYEQILKGSICKANQRIAHRLMQCLVVAVHPLRIEELAEVLVVDFDVKGSPPILNPGSRWADQEKAVMSACSSLVNIIDDGESRIVQFSHYSVKEYLMSERFAESNSEVSCYHIQLEPAHTILAQACLGVLLQLDHGVDRDSIQNFPLARYAAQYWVKHAQFGNVASRIEDGMDRLFDAEKPHFSTWLWIYDEDDHSSTPGMRPSKPKPVPLYYAGLFGFRDLARRLLKIHPEYINAQGGYHGTPFHASTSRGHVDLSSLLIDHLPDVDIRGIWNQTPLHRAAREGYLEIGQQLLSRGANVNAQDKDGWTPLHSAAFRGKVEFARMLLDHRAAVNATSNCGRSPLHLASIRGQVGVIRLLLKHGADRHARDNSGFTPCEVASKSGHKNGEIVQLLSQAECSAGAVQKLSSTHRHYDTFTVGNHTSGTVKKFTHGHYDT